MPKSIYKENAMIPLRFGLFWSGAKLSYLRYLTFATLRKHHPDAEIELHVSRSWRNTGFEWREEKQDFQENFSGPCWLDKLPMFGVKIVESHIFPDFPPNFQSDLFRWWWLADKGGFYLDTDQIVLRSFEGLPLDSDFICSVYPAQSCGIYAPVGVIGAKEGSKTVRYIKDHILDYYDPDVYNSIGPFMFRDVFEKQSSKEVVFNAPSFYFYPVKESYLISEIYNGNLDLRKGSHSGNKEIYSCHWFGGHPLSQDFNATYCPGVAKHGHDSISKYLRSVSIV